MTDNTIRFLLTGGIVLIIIFGAATQCEKQPMERHGQADNIFTTESTEVKP